MPGASVPRALPAPLALAVALVLSAAFPTRADALPPGFQVVTLTEQLTEPTCLAVTPDGRVLVGERGGAIRVIEDDVLLPSPLVALPVDTKDGERGVLEIVLHPHFAQNGWLYVFRTTPEPRDVVSRFTVTGNVANPASEVVVWQSAHLASTYHHGSGMTFDGSGHPHHLFVALGDQLNSGNAQDLSTEDGKILRLRDDGSIPADNPYVAVAGVPASIWASGVRNPFRLAWDDARAELLVGDVGGNVTVSWEEVSVVPKGTNLGWPNQEGGACSVSDCSPYHAPLWSYRHDDSSYYWLAPQGSVTLGPVATGTAYPSDYAHDLFVGDYANRQIRRLERDAAGAILSETVWLATPFAGTIVDLDVGPDGFLYFVTFGSGGALPDPSAVRRVEYSATGNVPPLVVANATPSAGDAPLTVSFSSAGTFDPDASPGPLAYAWDFGDGTLSSAPSPSHSYPARGKYVASVTVTDQLDDTTSAPLEIRVGHAPVPVITAPAPGLVYRAGDVIAFAGTATDQEDGPLPASALSWRVLLHHANHVHPFLGPLDGVASGSFTVPSTGHSPEGTHFEIVLAAVDSDGLDVETSVELSPSPGVLSIGTVPSGVPLSLDGDPLATPDVVDGLEGFQHTVAAPPFHVGAAGPLAFSCWSDGQAREHVVTTPSGGTNLTAEFVPLSTSIVAPAVPAADRNAQWTSAAGQQPSHPDDAVALGVGRDGHGPLQVGLEFPLSVPKGATVLSARLNVLAASAQAGTPNVAVTLFDVADAPPFVHGSSAKITSVASALGETVAWVVEPFVAGQTYASPELRTLVQAIVDRPDWQAGNHVGVLIDGTSTIGTQHRRFGNVAGGAPPTLEVEWAFLPPSGGACVPSCGFSTYGEGLGPPHVLTLIGTGSTAGGTTATVRATRLLPGAVAWWLIGLQRATLPFEGGTLLVDPTGFFVVLVLPTANGTSQWDLPIQANPAFAGFRLTFQVAAPDPAQSVGAALSNGLEMTICP